MNFIESFDNKTIFIPLLQRDYVQGGREDVIGPFVDSLIEKKCDLNYIYGYAEDGCFVPIDGQQRLTTLWLLYLYAYSKKQQKGEFHVRMKFEAREYADDFCKKLFEHLESLLGNVDADNRSLDNIIIDQNWFLNSWLSNVTVRNMLRTLSVIHRKINSANFAGIWSSLVESSMPNISFSFLEMGEENGLDDDIYIKMNGRGRKLTAFENLKSYMDEHVSKLPFAEQWKVQMDNAWTDMFWKNRNKGQEQPEEIDDEQLYCLYNLLILYHINRPELIDRLRNIKEDKSQLYEDLLAFLGKNEGADTELIILSIFEKLQKARNFPLVWFDRLRLMSVGFYDFAFRKLDKLAKLSDEFNNQQLYIGANTADEMTRTYRVCMCEGSFNRTLPLLYALLASEEGVTSLYDWMRTMRNLILNTNIDSKKLPDVMRVIDAFAMECKSRDVYSILLSDDNVNSILKVFDKNQVEEEILKASVRDDYYDQMNLLENGRFFSGCIGVLFRLLPLQNKDGFDTISQENVTAYSSILLELFDGNDNGIACKYDDAEKYLLRRAMMSYPPYYFGRERKSCWSFNKGIVEWREYIKAKDSEIGAFQLLLKELLVPAFKFGKDIVTALTERVEYISKNYELDILGNDANSYRFHFIHHPGVWGYMGTQRCIWNDSFDIELKASNGNNSNRMELRTMALYLDYAYNEDDKNVRTGWNVGIYPRGKSCFYFQLDKHVEDNRIVAMDVYFYDDGGKRSGETNYAFDLFVRPTHPDGEDEVEKKEFAEQDYKVNYDLFSKLVPEQMSLFERKIDGRLHCKTLYARHELKLIIGGLLNGIKAALDKGETKHGLFSESQGIK